MAPAIAKVSESSEVASPPFRHSREIGFSLYQIHHAATAWFFVWGSGTDASVTIATLSLEWETRSNTQLRELNLSFLGLARSLASFPEIATMS